MTKKSFFSPPYPLSNTFALQARLSSSLGPHFRFVPHCCSISPLFKDPAALHYISGVVHNYAWGRPASSSIIPTLLTNSQPWASASSSSASSSSSSGSKSGDDGKVYAELWWATHPNGQSRILPSSFLSHNNNTNANTDVHTDVKPPVAAVAAETAAPIAEADCPKIQQTLLNGASLPYILKVLSIDTALSLQAHPNKHLAAALHAKYPEVYKDGNHKPELVVALAPMQAMCGFRPPAEILRFAEHIPAFQQFIGAQAFTALQTLTKATTEQQEQQEQEQKRVLKQVFEFAMRNEQTTVTPLVDQLTTYMRDVVVSQTQSETVSVALAQLILSLSTQYPHDIGVFGPLLLNCIALAPGHSVFLQPDEPHAYLSGECVEIMAASDNVVRVGLTPKFRDVGTLVDMLSYEVKPPRIHDGAPVSTLAFPSSSSLLDAGLDAGFKRWFKAYAPPFEFPEFMVLAGNIPPYAQEVKPPQAAENEAKRSSDAAAAAAAAAAVAASTDDSSKGEGFGVIQLPVMTTPSLLVCIKGSGSVTFTRDSDDNNKADANENSAASGVFELLPGAALFVPGGVRVSVTASPLDGLSTYLACENIAEVSKGVTKYAEDKSKEMFPFAVIG